MTTALVSALSGRPVNEDVAMTGEITLTGQVLPIGGVKEKIIAASRAGIGGVIIPKLNEDGLADLPPGLADEMRITLADRIEQVLEVALEPKKPARRKRTKPPPPGPSEGRVRGDGAGVAAGWGAVIGSRHARSDGHVPEAAVLSPAAPGDGGGGGTGGGSGEVFVAWIPAGGVAAAYPACTGGRPRACGGPSRPSRPPPSTLRSRGRSCCSTSPGRSRAGARRRR